MNGSWSESHGPKERFPWRSAPASQAGDLSLLLAMKDRCSIIPRSWICEFRQIQCANRRICSSLNGLAVTYFLA
jgi:hypothetical protein